MLRKSMKTICLAVIISFCGVVSALAQTQDAPVEKTPPAQKHTTTEKPKLDLDGFFKDAETQTRKAQSRENSNCVPKAEEPEQTEPVS